MTTDTLETTEAPVAEAPLTEPAVTTPAPETPEEPAALEPVDEELTNLLKELELDEPAATKEPASSAPAAQNSPDEEVATPEARALASRLLKKENTRAQFAAAVQNFRGRANAISNFLTPVVNGERQLTPQDVGTLIATFNAHHADMQTVDAMDFTDKVQNMMASMLPEAERAEFFEAISPDDIVGALKEFGKRQTKGMYTETDLRKAKKEVAEAAWKKIREGGLNAGSRSPQTPSSGVGRGDNRSDAEKLLDPRTKVEELKAIRERQKAAGE